MPRRASLCGGTPVMAWPFEQHRALARPHQAHDGLERRRLADAVAAEQADDLAGADLQRDAMQDVALAVIGVQALDPDQRLGAVGVAALMS